MRHRIRAAKYSDFVRVIGFSKVSSYATDGYHDLHGFLREDSEGRGALCARACAHMTLNRGARASKYIVQAQSL